MNPPETMRAPEDTKPRAEEDRRLKVANFTDTWGQNNGVVRALEGSRRVKKAWDDGIFAPRAGLPVPFAPDYMFALSIKSITDRVRGFDIVHAHTPYPMFYYGWRAARDLKLPFIGSFHTDPAAFFGSVLSEGSVFGRFASRIMWRYLIKVYNNCDAVIAPSEQTRRALESRGIKRQVFVVPNGIDTTMFNPKNRTGEFFERCGIPKGKPVVLFVGRLEKRKRPDVFVKAALESESKAVFVIAGKGNMMGKLKGMAKGRPNIIFTGFLPEKLVPQAYAAADIFVMPSETETQGMVLFEAMASGCAVLSTDAGSAREVLSREHIFERGDVRGLAGMIDGLARNPKKLENLKQANRRLIEREYSVEACTKKLWAVYQTVLDHFNKDIKVSVIVPAYNEIKNIGACLSSIKAQTYRNIEILVADGGSKDGTVEIGDKYGRTVHCGNTGGPGPARNIGAKHAKGDIVAFTDADTLVPRDWVQEIVYNFAIDPDLIGVGGVLRPRDPRKLDTVMFKINSDYFYRMSSSLGFHQLATPCCAYRKDAFLSVGGFDESLSMFEDTDLSIRMAKKGKLKIDKDFFVFNSARRMKEEGYLGLFFRYLKVYLLYFSGKPIRTKHFSTISH